MVPQSRQAQLQPWTGQTEGTQRWAFTLFPENPTNSSSLRILVGSMDSVCEIRGGGCVEGILGKVRRPRPRLTLYSGERVATPSRLTPAFAQALDQFLPSQAGSAFASLQPRPTAPPPGTPFPAWTPGGSFQSQFKHLLIFLPWESSPEPLKRTWIPAPCGSQLLSGLSPSLALVSLLPASSLRWKQSGFPRLPISMATITHLTGVQATMCVYMWTL